MRRLDLISASFALASALCAAAPSSAEQFALFVYETPSDYAARTDPARAEAYWGGFAALGDEMKAAGIVRGGAPLTAPSEGGTVSVRDGASRVTPVDGSGETLSGWFVIDVADRAAAEAWAARVPAGASARVGVRPVMPIAMSAQ